MELRLLNREELAALYQQELMVVFPHAELKPLSAVLRLMAMDRYEPLLATEEDRPVGYALMWLPEDRNGALLDYFGVFRDLRSAGLGARILSLLGERFGQIFTEAEAPCSHDEDENDLRRRRIAFYERGGFRLLDYQCALFGVRFQCLYRGPEADDRKVESMHRGIYAGYFSPEHMERYIQLPLAPGEQVHPAPEWVEEALEVTLGDRTAETAAICFEKTDSEAFRKVLPQRAASVEEAVADFHASQRPGASSFGRTILAGGRYVGDVWCYGIDPFDTPGAMVGFCVFDPAFQRQGIASKALAAFLPEIAQRFALRTVGALTFSHNLPSIRVLEKNGFQPAEEFVEDGVSSQYFRLDLSRERA